MGRIAQNRSPLPCLRNYGFHCLRLNFWVADQHLLGHWLGRFGPELTSFALRRPERPLELTLRYTMMKLASQALRLLSDVSSRKTEARSIPSFQARHLMNHLGHCYTKIFCLWSQVGYLMPTCFASHVTSYFIPILSLSAAPYWYCSATIILLCYLNLHSSRFGSRNSRTMDKLLTSYSDSRSL